MNRRILLSAPPIRRGNGIVLAGISEVKSTFCEIALKQPVVKAPEEASCNGHGGPQIAASPPIWPESWLPLKLW